MRRFLGMAVLLLAACQSPTLPDGYVPLGKHRPTSMAAVASSGNRYEVREHDNPDNGTLEFWVDAIRRQLVEGRGYELVGEGPVASLAGDGGHELHFRKVHQLQPYGCLITVFVEDDRVVVFQAAGENDPFERDVATIRDAIHRTRW